MTEGEGQQAQLSSAQYFNVDLELVPLLKMDTDILTFYFKVCLKLPKEESQTAVMLKKQASLDGDRSARIRYSANKTTAKMIQ